MAAYFKIFVKSLAYAFAALIIFAATLVCVSRLMVPFLDDHRADFEKWASELLQAPVTISKARIYWYKYEPKISLDNVTVLNKTNQKPVLQAQNVSVFISIPQSLLHWKIVAAGLMISGSDLKLKQNAAGEITVQGFPALGGFSAQPYSSETTFNDFVGWLSAEPSLILRDIDVRYTGFGGQKRYVTLYNLALENSGSQHLVSGKAILHQDIPTEVSIAIQWSGNQFDWNRIKAKAYLYVSGLSVAQWMKGYAWHGWQINQGIGSAQIWAAWNHGAMQKFQANMQSYDINLYSQTDKSTHKINRLNGSFGWKLQKDGAQVFAAEDIIIDLPNNLWPVTNFYFTLAPDAKGVLQPKAASVGYVDLADIQSFLFSSSQLPASLKKILAELQLKGEVQNLTTVFSGGVTEWNKLSLKTNFNRLSVAPWQKLPGITNISGNLDWTGTQGQVQINSNDTTVKYDAILANDINFRQISAGVQVSHDMNNAWKFKIAAAQLFNDDLEVKIDGTINVPHGQSPEADLTAAFSLSHAQNITSYLPMKIFDPDLVKWLQSAFLSGSVKSGEAILRGPLKDYPFDQGNGIFQISGELNDIDFNYAPNWPRLTHVNGKLSFAGRQMLADIDHAQIQDIPVANVHGEIPYMGGDYPQILNVTSGDIHADLSQALNFVHASPLENTFGKMFTEVQLQGPMLLTLAFKIPLGGPEKNGVKGDLTIQNAEMNLAPWRLNLNHLNGHLQFTEDAIAGKNIQGNLFNKPLRLNLTTVHKKKDLSVIQARIATRLGVTDLQKWLDIPFSKVVSGAANVTGNVDFSFAAPVEIHLNSNLQGIAVNLPDTYGKKPQEAKDFSLDMMIEEKQPLHLRLNYAELLSTALVLERKDEKYNLTGANLNLGSEPAPWPSSAGLYIKGAFDTLDWDKIKTYMNQSGNTNVSAAMLKGIDVSAKKLNLFGQALTDTRLQVVAAQDNWKVTITSPEVSGQLLVPVSFSRHDLLTATFDKLELNPITSADHSLSAINVKSLPSINFYAKNVIYKDMPFGQVAFKAVPGANGMVIKSLRVASPFINLSAAGDWIQSKKGYVTHLRGNATSSRINDLLDSFGLEVHNFIASNGELAFNLSWNDAPYSPAIAIMNGKGTINLGKGRVVDIGQEGGAKMDLGRMLSIFSLQTLPRRLTLDFSDIFQKGYSFDSLKGDLVLKSGDLNTTNLAFDGPVARVSINGRIGLDDKDYDFILVVTPYVTSSLPVAATLLTLQPYVFLAAVAVNTVISPEISKATANYYQVTGPWDNPSWKSVNVGGKV